MKIRKRFFIWTLVSIFLTAGFNGFGTGLQPGHATEPILIGQAEQPSSETSGGAADTLALPEEESPESPESDAEGTLNLPDFEPQLPAESLPEPVATDESGTTWQESEVESAVSDTPKISKRQQVLITADEYYLAGDRATAEALYRQVKDADWQFDPSNLRPLPLLDPAALPPAAAVYWREAQAGYEAELTHRTIVPLELLVEEYPQFVPGQIFYANYLVETGRAEEADAMLDQALMIYPSQPELLAARTQTQMAMERWIEAAITAKQFVLLNPDHPDAAAMNTLSQENLDRFRAEMNAELTNNLIGNIVTGAAGLILTGGLIGPYTALNSTMILMQGESAVGASVAEEAKAELPMMTDPEVDAYINGIGQELASLAGRDEFDYEFFVVDDAELNAFALPGGKIFINSGAILKTHSEAELAGLLAHELSHAVLSHGFQLATNGNLINSVAGIIPIPEVGGIAAGLALTGYSREMERQADILGTQLLSTAGYAADGMYNLMVTLEEEVGDRGGIPWFSTHPAPSERVDYLQQIVEVGGYNRYAYEGVEPHLVIQERVQRLMAASSQTEETKE